jgi:hypothetical protein
VVPLEFVGKYQQMGDWIGPPPVHAKPATTPAARGANF